MECQQRECSFSSRLSTIVILPKSHQIDPIIFLEGAFAPFSNLVLEKLREPHMIKVNCTLVLEFIKNVLGVDIIENFYFNFMSSSSKNLSAETISKFNTWYRDVIDFNYENEF